MVVVVVVGIVAVIVLVVLVVLVVVALVLVFVVEVREHICNDTYIRVNTQHPPTHPHIDARDLRPVVDEITIRQDGIGLG